MKYILTLFVGFVLGILIHLILTCTSIEDLDGERWKAEQRALIFVRKIKTIEDIVKDGKANKENYFVILDKIEKELFQTSNQGK